MKDNSDKETKYMFRWSVIEDLLMIVITETLKHYYIWIKECWTKTTLMMLLNFESLLIIDE